MDRKDKFGIALKYPESLLTATVTERLDYFRSKDLIIEHPLLTDLLKQLMSAVDFGLDQNVILLIGPTGVGKTVLLLLAIRQILKEWYVAFPEDRVSIPGIFVEADAPDKGNFDFREFYIDGLHALRVSLIENTLPEISRTVDGKLIQTVAPEVPFRIPTPGSLRRRLRNTLKARKTQVFAIDEAVNFLEVRAYKSEVHRRHLMMANANSVRSIVNRLATSIVLAGAFDFYELAVASSQLARRSQVLYFPEYDDTPAGILGYTTGMLGLFAHLPAEHDLNPAEIAGDMFVQGVGRIGVTRTILFRFLKKGLTTGRRMDKDMLSTCFYPKAALKKMRQDAQDGRQKVTQFLKREEIEGWSLKPDSPSPEGEKAKAPPASPKLKPGETTPSRHWKEGSYGDDAKP